MAAMLNQEHMVIAYAASKNSKFIKKQASELTDACFRMK